MNIHRDVPSTGLLDWFAKHASALESSNPMVPLSEAEKEFVGKLVRAVEVIGLGEMTHGVLDQIKPELTANATGEERFLFYRFSRSLQKCINFYKFVDAGVLRDRCMAENILALREFLPS